MAVHEEGVVEILMWDLGAKDNRWRLASELCKLVKLTPKSEFEVTRNPS